MDYVKKFTPKDLSISESDQKALDLLMEAGEVTAVLYGQQKNEKYPGANFYPPDATKEEIQRAAADNPNILSPYTIVERDGDGQLVAVPYSKKYAQELKRAAQLLEQAAEVSTDEHVAAYLRARATDLLQDDFETSNTLWLQTKDSLLGCAIGPFDRYHDRLFFKKRSYTAYIGVLDQQKTGEVEKLREVVLIGERKYLPGSYNAKITRMNMRIEQTRMLAGFAADFLFVADALPSSEDLELIKNQGTISTLFCPLLEWRFEKWIWPIFSTLYTQDFQAQFTRQDIQQALLRVNTFSEITRTFMRFEDAAVRLQDLFPYFDESYSDLLAIKSTVFLFLKGVFTERELREIIVAEICQALYYLVLVGRLPHLRTNATGYAILLDFLLQADALPQKGGKLEIDFQRVLMAVDELARTIEYYMSVGSREDGQEFLKKFNHQETLQRLSPYIQEIVRKREEDIP
jgi:hypothetical protein